jgi:hypothetical protein
MNANERQYSNPKTEVENAAVWWLIGVDWRSLAANADRRMASALIGGHPVPVSWVSRHATIPP